MGNHWFEEKKHWQIICILIGVSYLLLMFGNGQISLTHPDEVFYIQTAKEMMNHRSWLVPIIFDQPQFEKPILSYVFFAVAIKIFGLGPFVARFWPAFFGILGVAVTYALGWALWQRKRQAFFSALVLSSSFIYLALSRAVLTDMIFSIFILIAITFFYLSYRYPRHRQLGLLLFFFFAGISVLTKGILGAAIPWLTVFTFLIFKKDIKFLWQPAAVWGIIIFLAVALPWHILMYHWFGQGFIEEYFHNVHFRRLFEAEHRRLDHWYFYPGLMIVGVMPWSLFVIPAIFVAIKNTRKGIEIFEPFLFIFCWVSCVFILLEPAKSKLASYIFPLFPGLALLIGHYIDSVLTQVEQGKDSKFFQIVGHVMTFILAGAIVGTFIASDKYHNYINNKQPVYIFSILMALAATTIFVFNRKRRYSAMLCSFVLIPFSLIIMSFFAKPYAEAWVSCKPVIDILKKIDNSQSTILASKFYVRGVRFYSDRNLAVIDINGSGFFSPHPIPFLNSDSKVLEFLNTQSITYAVVKKGDVSDLNRITSGENFSIEELNNTGGKYILKISKTGR